MTNSSMIISIYSNCFVHCLEKLGWIRHSSDGNVFNCLHTPSRARPTAPTPPPLFGSGARPGAPGHPGALRCVRSGHPRDQCLPSLGTKISGTNKQTTEILARTCANPPKKCENESDAHAAFGLQVHDLFALLVLTTGPEHLQVHGACDQVL